MKTYNISFTMFGLSRSLPHNAHHTNSRVAFDISFSGSCRHTNRSSLHFLIPKCIGLEACQPGGQGGKLQLGLGLGLAVAEVVEKVEQRLIHNL